MTKEVTGTRRTVRRIFSPKKTTEIINDSETSETNKASYDQKQAVTSENNEKQDNSSAPKPNKNNAPKEHNNQGANEKPQPSENTEPEAPRETIAFDDLKKSSPSDLVAIAQELGIENADTLIKQNLLFQILKQHAYKGNRIVGGGVLDVLNDGFGF